MGDNFYIVLGISSDADLGQIRTAYRRLVRKLHPDVNPDPPDRFLQVQKAYETLSDPQTRRLYDEQFLAHPPSPIPVQFGRPRHAVAMGESALRPKEIMHAPLVEMEDLFSSADAFFGGFVPGFFRTGAQTSRRKDLYVEVILSPEEAEAGGLFPLQIPVKEVCFECGGTGYRGMFCCPACMTGNVYSHEVTISVPPGVMDGDRAQLTLEDMGLPKVVLNVLVLVR